MAAVTRYSPLIPATRGQSRALRFDWTDGWVGIDEMEVIEDGEAARVILSPPQVKALVRWIETRGRKVEA